MPLLWHYNMNYSLNKLTLTQLIQLNLAPFKPNQIITRIINLI